MLCNAGIGCRESQTGIGGRALGDAKNAACGALHKAHGGAPWKEVHIFSGPEAYVHCVWKHLEATAFQPAGDLECLLYVDIGLGSSRQAGDEKEPEENPEHWFEHAL